MCVWCVFAVCTALGGEWEKWQATGKKGSAGEQDNNCEPVAAAAARFGFIVSFRRIDYGGPFVRADGTKTPPVRAHDLQQYADLSVISFFVIAPRAPRKELNYGSRTFDKRATRHPTFSIITITIASFANRWR